jgi:hypothetical protein
LASQTPGPFSFVAGARLSSLSAAIQCFQNGRVQASWMIVSATITAGSHPSLTFERGHPEFRLPRDMVVEIGRQFAI